MLRGRRARTTEIRARAIVLWNPASREGHPVNAIEERVHRRRTALDPVRQAVATPAPVVERHVDDLRWATLDHLGLDAPPCQRAVTERRDDRRAALGRPRTHVLPRARCEAQLVQLPATAAGGSLASRS